MTITPDLLALFAQARAEGRVSITDLDPTQLVLRIHGEPPKSREERERLAAKVIRRGLAVIPAEVTTAPGPLAELMALIQGPRRISALAGSGSPVQSVLAMPIKLHLVVPDGGDADVVVVQRQHVHRGESAESSPVEVELARVDVVLEELVELAFRAPLDGWERSEKPGSELIFFGPDRKTSVVSSSLVHDWDAPRATLYAWSYSLLGRRTGHDWVSRQPTRGGRYTPALYRKHLNRRLAQRDPEPMGEHG